METNPILKVFIVDDPEKWEELKREAEKPIGKFAKRKKITELERGREKLKQFSFR